jgi:Do/DeqQ family serine protease
LNFGRYFACNNTNNFYRSYSTFKNKFQFNQIIVEMKTKNFFSLVTVAILGGFIALFSYTRFFEKRSLQISAEGPNISKFTSMDSSQPGNAVDFTYAAEKSVHAVVHVKTKTIQHGYSDNPLLDFFFGDRMMEQNQQPVAGFGSGVLISNDGYIVTNNHVVDNADEIEVTLNDKRTYKAEIIGKDPDTDIAVLKIKETELPFISYGNSDDMKIGEWVLAVGNPYNLTSTVTAGIISAKARSLNLLNMRNGRQNSAAIESFIQTDAAVNPGNSGGALVNTKGELIGINTAIASPTGSYIGNSFAIPVTIVRKVVRDLIEFGKVQRALLGIGLRDIDSDLAQKLKLDKMEGVYVNNVFNSSGAAEAGIKEGDIILSFNGTSVNSTSQLQEQVSRYRPNDKVEIVINRENKKKLFLVTLRNMDGTTKMVSKNEVVSVLGAKLEETTAAERLKLHIQNGVKVTEVGEGKFRTEGVEKGFIITSINNQTINTTDDVKRILSGIKGGVYIEGIYPNGTVAYYAFGL